MPDPAVKPIPRRGRWRMLAVFCVALGALGYAIFELSTREAGRQVVRVQGGGSAQAIFGGMRQAGERLGSPDAPVTVQIFNDIQCASCAPAFLGPVPVLAEQRVRSGEVKLLMRHYSFARNPLELGFFAAEAAARQGYGWQYAYLFFRNQEEAERFGVGDKLLESLAASIGDLDLVRWRRDLKLESGEGGEIREVLEGHEALGAGLGIRARPAAIVSGPRGTRALQDDPGLARIEAAIEAVS